jgi:hypothetical protein
MVAVALLALSLGVGRLLIQWSEWRAYEQGLAAERAEWAALRAKLAKVGTSQSTSPAPAFAPSGPK